MEWIYNLFFGTGIAHTMVLLAIVIAAGFILGKVKVFGVSLGITWILFVGIILSHFGMLVDAEVLHFIKEFGLILFVYSLGMQVGPGFFSAFKKGGVTLNMLATLIVFLGVIITYVFYLVTGLPITTMVGILSGAVTNTPGLGAAQQTYYDINGASDPSIAMGYAVAYPLGVIGIIISLIAIRYIFRVNMEKESDSQQDEEVLEMKATHISVAVKNPALVGRRIDEVTIHTDREFVVSRILYAADGKMEIASGTTVLSMGDRLYIIIARKDIDAVVTFFGERVDMHRADWETKIETELISRRILVTRSEINGKRLGSLHLRSHFGVNITRINRSGIDLVANIHFAFQIGDRVTVVGTPQSIENVEKLLGNSMKRLNEPNLITIFVGIFIGVLLGSLPIMVPGIPQPVKLGLAGGPLIVAILMSRFGAKYHLITYTTMSANLMLREVGISLFLASVGLSAGQGFVETVVNGGGYVWIGYGVIITMAPLLVVGLIARLFYKMNYFTLTGLLSGSMTDPPALAFANSQTSNDLPAVGYATVYPLTMFLRVLTAQLLILLCL